MANVTTTPPKNHDTALKNFAPKGASDCVSDKTMKEIARRLLIFFQRPAPQIVRSAAPPSDKTKLWLPVDEDTGAVTDVLKVYSSETGTWKNATELGQCLSGDEDNKLQLDGEGCLLVPGGKLPGIAEVFDESITADGDGEAEVDLVYTKFEDTNAEIAVNVTDTDPGADFRWCIEDRAVNGCTVHFYGVTGTLTLKIYARRTD
jgi:hypothetical protein